MRLFWLIPAFSLLMGGCGSSSGGSGGGGDATGGGSVVGVDMSPGKACTETTGTHCYDDKVMKCTLGAWSMVENCAPAACAEKFVGQAACASGVVDAGGTDGASADGK